MIKHHPSDETLFRYANGSLEAGPGIVVAVHMGGCIACAKRVAEFEAIGGVVLDDMEPAPVDDAALDRLFATIEKEGESAASDGREATPARAKLGIRLPAALDRCSVGPWRWVGPGVRWSRVTLLDEPGANVMLLKVAAGRKLPEHTHDGFEYTQVLKGSFHDSRGRYEAGDMDEADDDVQHRPIVDNEGECICLAALDGRMRLRGIFGRLIQPLIGG